MTDIGKQLGPEFAEATKQSTITPEMVGYARAKGVGYICANCEKFWRGVEMGRPQCLAVMEGKKCGGPMVGLTFPEYKGPLPRIVFPSLCFVCGVEATAGIQVRESSEMIGICKEHEVWIGTMRPFDSKKDGKHPLILKVRTEVPT